MSPTILLVPGAWHPAETIAPLQQRLQDLGYSVEAAQLSSVGSNTATVADDTAALASGALNPLLEKGADVVVVAHSYAGFAVSPLLAANAKKNRQSEGKAGGIVGTVFMCAFVPLEGLTLEMMAGGKLPPWQLVDEERNIVHVDDPKKVFYLDVPDVLSSRMVSILKHQSLPSSRSPAGHAGYADPAYEGRRAYILGEDDNAIPPFAQKAMYEGSGVEWDVKKLKSSHSPFLSQTNVVADYISNLAKQWSC